MTERTSDEHTDTPQPHYKTLKEVQSALKEVEAGVGSCLDALEAQADRIESLRTELDVYGQKIDAVDRTVGTQSKNIGDIRQNVESNQFKLEACGQQIDVIKQVVDSTSDDLKEQGKKLAEILSTDPTTPYAKMRLKERNAFACELLGEISEVCHQSLAQPLLGISLSHPMVKEYLKDLRTVVILIVVKILSVYVVEWAFSGLHGETFNVMEKLFHALLWATVIYFWGFVTLRFLLHAVNRLAAPKLIARVVDKLRANIEP